MSSITSTAAMTLDRIADWIPVVSGIANLFLKYVWLPQNNGVTGNHYYDYLKTKESLHSVPIGVFVGLFGFIAKFVIWLIQNPCATKAVELPPKPNPAPTPTPLPDASLHTYPTPALQTEENSSTSPGQALLRELTQNPRITLYNFKQKVLALSREEQEHLGQNIYLAIRQDSAALLAWENRVQDPQDNNGEESFSDLENPLFIICISYVGESIFSTSPQSTREMDSFSQAFLNSQPLIKDLDHFLSLPAVKEKLYYLTIQPIVFTPRGTLLPHYETLLHKALQPPQYSRAELSLPDGSSLPRNLPMSQLGDTLPSNRDTALPAPRADEIVD